MPTFSLPIRAVFYREDDAWVAHCLEFDVCGHGETQREALRHLSEAIVLQAEASLEFDNPHNLFSPADGKFFEMFAGGRAVAVGEFGVEFVAPQVTIEDVQLREYAGSPSLPAGDIAATPI